jgi:hypothetical protein
MAEFREKIPGTGKFKGTGVQRTDPLGEMSSPMSQIVGGLVYRGEQLLDPESEESQRLISSITEAPLAQIDYAEEKGQQTLATSERAAYRQQRDLGLAGGGMRMPGAEAAVAARTAETFGTARANLNAQMGMARASIIGDARKFYEENAPQWALNSVNAADAWINNRPWVNETYLKLSTSLTQSAMALGGQMAGAMSSIAGTGYATAVQAQTAQRQLDASQETDWVSLAVGVVATVAGAFAGGVGAVAGAALLAGTAATTDF